MALRIRSHSGYQRLVFVDCIDGKAPFAPDELARCVPHARRLRHHPTRTLDDRCCPRRVDYQLEIFAAAGAGQALVTHLPAILRGPCVGRGVEVHRDPASAGTRSRQVTELASQDVLAEIHRESFEDEQCRPRPVESMIQQRLCGALGPQVGFDVLRAINRGAPYLVPLSRSMIQFVELHTVVGEPPRSTVIASSDHSDLSDTSFKCAPHLSVVPQHTRRKAGPSHRPRLLRRRPMLHEPHERPPRRRDHRPSNGIGQHTHLRQQRALSQHALRRPRSLGHDRPYCPIRAGYRTPSCRPSPPRRSSTHR